MSDWYYAHDGQQKGPVPVSELQRLAADGQFDPATDLVWKEGMDDWKTVAQIPELAAEMAPPSAAPAATDAPATPAAPDDPYSTPAAPAPQPAQPAAASPAAAAVGAPKTGLALASLICGLVALVSCVIWCLSLPLAIAAVVMGHIALAKAKADPANFGGAGMAKGGLITGYLSVVAAIVVVAFSFWLASLSPEEIQQLDWIPEAQRQEFIDAMEEQRRMMEETQGIEP